MQNVIFLGKTAAPEIPLADLSQHLLQLRAPLALCGHGLQRIYPHLCASEAAVIAWRRNYLDVKIPAVIERVRKHGLRYDKEAKCWKFGDQK